MNEIVFVCLKSKINFGSCIELGKNLSAEIGNHTSSRYCYANTDIHNSIVIFVKFFNIGLANKLLKNNNKIFYFVVDEYPCRKSNFPFEGIIFSNKRQQQDFLKYYMCKKSYIYYHHSSPSYTKILNKDKNIGYFVAKENVNRILASSKHVDIHTNFKTYDQEISRYKFHIEYRKTNSKNFLYKPCAKLATAAFAESVFICSKDCSYSELLPNDYPFYLNDIEDKNIDMLLEEMISSPNYSYGKDIILNLKETLSIKNTAKKLLEFLS